MKWFTVFYCIAMSWCRKELGLLVILMLPLLLFFAFANAQCGEIFFERIWIIPIPLHFNKLHLCWESLKKTSCETLGVQKIKMLPHKCFHPIEYCLGLLCLSSFYPLFLTLPFSFHLRVPICQPLRLLFLYCTKPSTVRRNVLKDKARKKKAPYYCGWLSQFAGSLLQTTDYGHPMKA